MKTSIFYLLLLPCTGFCQTSLQDSILFSKLRGIFVSTDIEYYGNSVLMGFHQPIKKDFSLMIEAGYANGRTRSYTNLEPVHGFKIRGEFRWLRSMGRRSRHYLGVQYMRKHLKEEGFYGKFMTGNPQYKYDYSNYEYRKNVDAIHLTGGKILVRRKRLLFDFGFYIGLLLKQTRAIGVPNDYLLDIGEIEEAGLLDGYEETPDVSIKPSAGLTLRIGWSLVKMSDDI